MEIDNYRNFLAIVEAGSMTSASEFVHIAQPALSKQLKSLEGYFGTKLIITTRGSKHLILTDAGKILYHKAKYICSLEDMARIEIDDISDGNRGTLRISAANSRSSIFIKTCLEPFHDLFPNVVYEIYEGISPAAVSRKPTQSCTKRWSRSKAVPSPSSRGSSSSSILKRAIPKEWESSARCCKEIQGLRDIMPTF